MILAYIFTFISFFIDLFLSSFIPIINTSNNFLIPMFTIISLVLMYPYFINKNKEFIIYSLVTGFIYDIVVTNTLCFNMIMFSFIAFLIIMLDNNLSNNITSIIVKSFIIIFSYDIVVYFVLVLINYINFNILGLLIKLVKSILLNLIYIIISYNILDKISQKFNIKKLS